MPPNLLNMLIGLVILQQYDHSCEAFWLHASLSMDHSIR